MESKPFQVVFSGKLDPDLPKPEILSSLCALFRTDPEKIRSVFRGPGALIVKCATREQADKYVAAIRQAGAVCAVLAPQPAAPAPPPPSVPSHAARTSAKPEIIDPVPGKTELMLTPVRCSRIGGGSEGLTTNRLDRAHIPFDQLTLAAVFKPVDGGDELELLLFTRDIRRPLLAAGSAVAFGEFAEVAGPNLHTSLRNFLTHLRRKNPELLLDRGTAAFLAGEAPALFSKDPLCLVSDLDRALAGVIARKPPAVAPPRPAPRAHTPPPKPVPVARAPEDFAAADAEPAPPAAAFAAWAERRPNRYALLLLLGFAWPLLKHSMLFSSQVIWPWNLMGFGLGAESAAAMATVSEGENRLAWAILPLAAAALIFFLQKYAAGLRRFAGFFLVGAGSLLLLLVFLVEEAEVLGLILVPPTTAGGAMAFIVVLAGTAAAAANHLRKDLPEAKALRIVAASGGAMLLLAAAIAFLASSWSGWTIQVFYLLLAAYGGLSLKNALRRQPEESALGLASAVSRGILIWFPMACLFTQRAQDDPFTTYVVGGGGGFLHLFFSTVKLCLIYYGSALLLALGLAGILARMLVGRSR